MTTSGLSRGTYQVLTTETGEKIPRINLMEPEKSLLLQKPTMAVPHGGGQPLRPNSADYETILNWVRNGAPYGEEGEASGRVVRVEVEPDEVVLAPRGQISAAGDGASVEWAAGGHHRPSSVRLEQLRGGEGRRARSGSGGADRGNFGDDSGVGICGERAGWRDCQAHPPVSESAGQQLHRRIRVRQAQEVQYPPFGAFQ